jgi:hypothetical protein
MGIENRFVVLHLVEANWRPSALEALDSQEYTEQLY